VSARTDVSTDVLTYSEERVTDVLGRSDDEVVVRAYGEDPTVLDGLADELQPMVAGVEGVAKATVDRAPVEAAMEVEVDLDRAQEFALKPGDVRRQAASLLGGITVGNLFDDQKVFDVVVWGSPDIRNSESDVERLLIETAGGERVRLDEVANVRIVDSPTMIRHESVSAYLDVVAEVPGGDVAAVQEEIDQMVADVEAPREHHAEVLSAASAQQTDQWQLMAAGLAALFAILLVLQAAFGSWRLAAIGFLSLPLALVGGVVAVLLSGGTITLGSAAGFLAVLGIASRAVVLLIRHYQNLLRHESATFGPELVARGTSDCVVPTVVSALGIAVLVAPFAVLSGSTGFEIVGPMALVVLGGLVTTTLVTLVLVPAFYLRFGSVGPDGLPRDLFDDVAEEHRPGEHPDRQHDGATRQPAGAVQRRAAKAAWPIALLALLGTACGGAVADEYVVENDPGKAVKIPGTHHVQVVLQRSAADRLQIETMPVEQEGGRLVVPQRAVFVDTDGQWWVYRQVEPLAFEREKVAITRQAGGRAFFSAGPGAGTEVVTVGVPELYGVEEEVGH